MTQLTPFDRKSQENDKQPPRASVMKGIERAAGDLNPLLMIFAIGLGLLDVTCYLGIVASRQAALHTVPAAAVSTNNTP